MANTAAVIEQFAGLDLRADPGEGAPAIDLMNVTLEPGRVRTRDGFTNFYTPSGAGVPVALFTFNAPGGPWLLAIDRSPKVYMLTTAGVASFNFAVADPTDIGSTAVAVGTPAGSYIYFSHAGAIYYWNDGAGALGTLGTGPANPLVLGLSPTDNRLAVGAQASKLSFSQAGDPQTYVANNYVYLTPGDGEDIRGMATFNNQLFVFKRSRFFVFYGNSTDSSGNPVFNYRAVDGGRGMESTSRQSVTSAPDGVYFIASDGIYRTTGEPAVKVSQALQPFFDGYSSSATGRPQFWGGPPGIVPGFASRLHWHRGRLYASFQTAATTGVTFVLDPELGWSAWDTPMFAMASFQQTSTATDTTTLFFANRATSKIVRMEAAATTDGGSAIASRYRSAFMNFGNPGRKVIRETRVEGYGTPTLSWSHDWGVSDAGAALAMGSPPGPAGSRSRVTHRGRWLSWQAALSSGAWALNRVEPILLDATGPPGVG